MLKLTLVTPEKKLLTEYEVQEVFVPALKGQLNILPGHAALITTLETGILSYLDIKTGKLKSATISWGYCEVYNDHVNVLAETAEFPEEIDVERAKQALKTSSTKIEKGEVDFEELIKVQGKVRRAQSRLDLIEQTKNSSKDS
jgi:F-type H+-transporting ATPase subunit epsilon